MKAVDVMTPGVVTIAPEATVADAAKVMLEKRISGLPVVDRNGKLVGMLTEGDFLRRSETGAERRRPRWIEFLIGPRRLADEYIHSHGRKVAEVMTPDVATADESASVADIVALMEKRRVKRIPILRGGKIIGIVSRANLVQAFATIAEEAKPVSTDDAAIRSRILDQIAKEPWAPRSTLNISVRDGIVHLWGCIFDERERQGLHVTAENTPGVKGVRDHLVWIEPTSGFVIESPDNTSERKA